MACPTCDKTMTAIVSPASPPSIGADIIHWCPCCGTCKDTLGVAHVPKLVERCREFEPIVLDSTLEFAWAQHGIAESINLPANRPAP